MKKIKIFKTRSEFESFVNSVDVEILQIDIKAVEISYYFQDGFAAVVFYKENNHKDNYKGNSAMTKEQAIKILQDAYNRGIDQGEDVQIFDALKFAISALQSDLNAPDWSKAPDWAQWYAIDRIDGTGWWYENEPEKDVFRYLPHSGKNERDINENFPILFKRPE